MYFDIKQKKRCLIETHLTYLLNLTQKTNNQTCKRIKYPTSCFLDKNDAFQIFQRETSRDKPHPGTCVYPRLHNVRKGQGVETSQISNQSQTDLPSARKILHLNVIILNSDITPGSSY